MKLKNLRERFQTKAEDNRPATVSPACSCGHKHMDHGLDAACLNGDCDCEVFIYVPEPEPKAPEFTVGSCSCGHLSWEHNVNVVGPRGICLIAGCKCETFNEVTESQPTITRGDACVCGHAFSEHSPFGDPPGLVCYAVLDRLGGHTVHCSCSEYTALVPA